MLFSSEKTSRVVPSTAPSSRTRPTITASTTRSIKKPSTSLPNKVGGSGSVFNNKPAKPSDRLNPKTCMVGFNHARCKTAFSSAYQKGSIPCRLVHGSVRHSIAWSIHPSDLPTYNPILVTFFDGLVETDHPYSFLVSEGIIQMLQAEGSYEKTLPILQLLIRPLRMGLGSKEKSVIMSSLKVLGCLAKLVENLVLPVLPLLLPPLAGKVVSGNSEVSVEVMETLRLIECTIVQAFRNGSESGDLSRPLVRREDCALVLKMIKAKIPTYVSVYF